MNNLYKTFLFLAISFCTLTLQAQQRGLSKTVLQKKYRMIECEKKAINGDDFFDTYRTEMGLGSSDEMHLHKTIAGSNGYEHVKYQQFHNGVLVEGSSYTLHLKNGIVKSASGYYLPLINLDSNPSISAKEALQNAMQEMGAVYYNFNDPSLPVDRLKNAPKPELVFMDAAYPKSSEQYVLAYKVRLASTQPLDKKDIFIHAHYGQKVLDLPRMHHQGVPATVQTKFYGEQTITVDSVAPKEFYLRDPSRNNNTTSHIDGYVWKDDNNKWELANENEDEVALDAHYCGQEFHDYLVEKFNWSGLDGNGEPMNSVVKLGNTVNAFWDGEAAHFYDGGCHHFPLTTLEVVAHEFTHGLTDYTSDLVYSGESGAINESMSDIFGKALEFHVEPNEFSWDLGHSFLETDYVESFRSFINPNDREHPKFYNGEYWFDAGGVHTNSSVGNHWFYNLVEGGTGMNEVGESYDLTGLGWDEAMQIVFKTQSAYLMANSTYNDYYSASIAAAEEIFGANAPQIDQVKEAWKVVGLPTSISTIEVDLALSFGQRFVSTCLDNEYYGIEMTISNVGSVDYVPMSAARVDLEASGDQQTIELADAIASGESFTYIIDDLVFFDNAGSVFVQGEIVYGADEVEINDDGFLFVRNYISQEKDISFGLSISERNCTNKLHAVDFFIRNQSCTVLPAGTELNVILENASGFQWGTTYTTEIALNSGGRAFFSEEIELEDVGEYSGEVILMDELELSDNSDFTIIDDRIAIQENYFNPFDMDDDYIKKSDGFEMPILNLNNESVLVFTGRFNETNTISCPDAGENYESSPANVRSISICSNLETIEKSKMSFDLTQYRNEEAIEFQDLVDNSSIMKISWQSDTEEDEMIVLGLEEGLPSSFEMPLPDFFKGEINFDFYGLTGDVFGTDPLTYDVTLLDNLVIEEVLTSITDFENIPIKISPNPSAGIFVIEHPAIPKSMELFSIHGQLIKHFDQAFQLDKLDLSDLTNGIYLLTVDYGELGKTAKRLVKQQ